MNLKIKSISKAIKTEAIRLGFSSFGIAKVEFLEQDGSQIRTVA